MKVKTSITLSEELIRAMDALSGQYGTRSALIEQAVHDFLATIAQRQREAHRMWRFSIAVPRHSLSKLRMSSRIS
jgi:metal-responsive CopG/Arc/MetJ family transcriptional regulator